MVNATLREGETSVFPLRAQDILTSSLARPRLQRVLNASLSPPEVIQVHIQDIKLVLSGFLGPEQIDSVRQVCEKNRDYETHEFRQKFCKTQRF